MSGRGRGGGRGWGGRGGGRGGGGRGQAGGGEGKEGTEANGSGDSGGARTTEYEDEFDTVRSTRQIKGDEEDDYVAGAAAGRDLEGGDDDEEDDNVRRMTKQFAWEEERMEEEFNEAGDKMEPFNLKAERTEGYFDETGNFVWKKEEGDGDPWLASLENEEDLEARIGEAAVARRKKYEWGRKGREGGREGTCFSCVRLCVSLYPFSVSIINSHHPSRPTIITHTTGTTEKTKWKNPPNLSTRSFSKKSSSDSCARARLSFVL